MRKRLIMLALACILACSTVACSKGDSDETVTQEKEKKSSKNKTDKTDIETEITKEAEETTIVTGALTDRNNIYLADDGGNVRKIVEWPREDCYVCRVEYIDDYIYAVVSDYSGPSAMYVYDLDGNVHDKLFEGAEQGYMFAEKYNGKIYMSYNDTTDYQNTAYYVFEYDAETKKLTEVSDFEASMSAIRNNEFKYIGSAENLIKTLERDNGECFLTDLTYKNIVKFDVNNNSVIETYSIFDDAKYENGWCVCKAGDWVLYQDSGYVGDIIMYEQTMYNIKNGQKIKLCEGEYYQTYSVIDFDDKNLYMYFKGDDVSNNVTVVSFNLSTGEITTLYSDENPIGTNEYYVQSGISNAKILMGKLFFETIDNYVVKWAYYDVDKKEKHMTNADIHEYSWVKYGDITVAEDKIYYPGTEEQSYWYRLEEYTLKDSVKNASKINDDLKAKYDEAYQWAMNGMESMKDETYNEEYSYYMSLERNVMSVTEIGSHYLQIDFAFYDYSGGAHGMGWDDYLLYDLNTGESVTIKELTTLSEEEYKKVIADKSTEFWKSAPEYTFFNDYKYEPSYEPTIYQEFYDGANMETDTIQFTQDGIYIMYPPYLYGSYSSGWISVKISYEDLGIDINK